MCSNVYSIRQEILFLFPFVLLQYSRAFLLMQQQVICDFCKSIGSQEEREL
jgi:hypothetical protein